MLTIAGGAAAQDKTCTSSDSPISCWLKFVPAVAVQQPAPGATESATQETVAAANTGLSNLVSPSTSSLKDFLSVLSASIESSSLSNDGNALTFDTNLPSPLNGDAHRIKLQFVFDTPQLDPQIADKLSSNSAQVTALQDDLTSTDNVTGSLSFNPATTSIGRSIAPHGDFFDALVAVTFPTQGTLDEARRNAIRAANITDPSKPFSDIDDSVEAATIQQFQASASALGSALANTEDMRKAFALLLSNQPQAYGSALYHYRSVLVGPDEYGVKATLELSSRNLRSFYKLYTTCTPDAFRNGPASGRTAAASDCLAKLKQYAAPLAARDSGTRLSLSVEHRMTDARTYTLPDNLGTVQNDEATSTTATLVLGFVPMARDTTTGRLDFTASFENVSGDPLRDNRFVASATYTQKINDMLSIPVSLVYANRDQYLSNVDEKLNAHFGIIYKLPTGK
jgi:hypothetical protein